MKEFINKFIELERRIKRQKGAFTLFALFMRDNGLNKWDVVVAAPWIDSDRKEALDYISQQLQLSLTRDEVLQISRIALIDETNPTLDEIQRTLQPKHGVIEMMNSDLFGLEIKRAFIITAQKLPAYAEMVATS
jgi:hypothetical protein